MGPSCLKNKAGPQMTINQSLAVCSPTEEPATQPGWKGIRTLTLGPITASATPSSHLINSPDLHYSVWRMGEVVLTAGRNCASSWVSILPLLFASCVTLGKSPEPPFPHLQKRSCSLVQCSMAQTRE